MAELTSVVCRAEHFRSEWFRHWQAVLMPQLAENEAPSRPLHRKLWECCAITQALSERGMLAGGRCGLGFAVGREPLPSLFAMHGVRVTASDLHPGEPAADVWMRTGQHASHRDDLYVGHLVSRDAFDQLVSFAYVNMLGEWTFRAAAYDFVWSACSFEHLGSLRAGLDFVVRASALLKPGGVGVHTTEFNVSSNAETLATGGTVLYRRRDIEELDGALRRHGFRLAQPDFFPGQDSSDELYDIPPYGPDTGRDHIKLLLSGFVTTSMLLIVLA